MKVAYISGPIAGHALLNEGVFRAAERRLLSTRNQASHRYDKVLVPHDIPPWGHMNQECPPSYIKNGDHTAACYLRTDLIHLLTYVDDVWMLPGWEASVGARLEMQVAAACGLGIKFFHRNELGCAHNGYGVGKCGEDSCWNYRVPVTAAPAVQRRAEAPLLYRGFINKEYL